MQGLEASWSMVLVAGGGRFCGRQHQRGAMCTTRRVGTCARRAVQRSLLSGVAACCMVHLIGIARLLCFEASLSVETAASQVCLPGRLPACLPAALLLVHMHDNPGGRLVDCWPQ
jgi:hypothetical protein